MRRLLVIAVTVIAMLTTGVPAQAHHEIPENASLCAELFGFLGPHRHGNPGAAVSGTAMAGLCKGDPVQP